jgi:AraC-like DNA-binding protein
MAAVHRSSFRVLKQATFAALKPGAHQHEFWKADGLLLDEKALHLGVAQVAQSREAALEYAARLFERSAGSNMTQQSELCEEPTGGHTQLMHSLF